MKKPILVTGGAGYIGSQNCKELAKRGFLPITFDNLSTGNENFIKWGSFFKGDLKDKDRLSWVIKKTKPTAVMHFAANALVSESIKNPKKYYENNVIGTLNLLNAMLENDIRYLIFSSSCATYGHPQFSPMCENHPQEPISPYGKSKYMIEQILKDYKKAYNLKYISLRYFNAAGADLDVEIGEDREEESHLIPLAIDTALGINSDLNIYGTDFNTKDGTAIRDYIHVQDLATAHMRSLNYLFDQKRSLELNLGSETGFSVLEVINEIQSITNTKITMNFLPRREGDPEMLFATSKKAKEHLLWEPKFSDLKTILTSAIKWHKKKKVL
ncbi:MAG TPA: UDP-glucose 4-epimerase GalE [Chlamydiae bacterium]|nr:UDP-glucose 4-epimerase GalE [Chlamydiota bacterium]